MPIVITDAAKQDLTNSPYTTNRILEIPQDIKLELNNGTLTLKAGSKVYVPNGFEADGTTPKFDEFITTNDIIDHDFGNDNKGVAFLITKHDAIQFSVWTNTTVVSGTSAPDFSSTGYWGVWYDTSNNIIKNQAGTNEWKDFQGFSLPFCLVSSSSSAVTSLDQVFNGFGYIDSTVFVLPGVKVQTPNGKNTDGTYKSVIRTIDSVRTYNASAWGTRNLNIIASGDNLNILFEGQAVERFTYNKQFSSDTTTYSYDENTGQWWYSPDQSSWFKSALNIVGFCRVESGKITQFQVGTVDSVANSNASNLSQAGRSYLSGLGMPSYRYIDLTLLASGSRYTAQANGWFSAYCATGSSSSCYLLNNTNGINSVGTVIERLSDGRCYIPVNKGDVISFFYNGFNASKGAFLRFIYAEGDQ